MSQLLTCLQGRSARCSCSLTNGSLASRSPIRSSTLASFCRAYGGECSLSKLVKGHSEEYAGRWYRTAHSTRRRITSTLHRSSRSSRTADPTTSRLTSRGWTPTTASTTTGSYPGTFKYILHVPKLQPSFDAKPCQIWLDPSEKATTGQITHYSAVPFVDPHVAGSVVGPAPNVSVTTTAIRQLIIIGEVITGSGCRTEVTWSQDLSVRLCV
jgi:hypothetical protein